jgi:hypothetical protein
MPPPFPLDATDRDGERPPSDAVIASLAGAAGAMLHARGGGTPTVRDLLAHGYEGLPPCLPSDS